MSDVDEPGADSVRQPEAGPAPSAAAPPEGVVSDGALSEGVVSEGALSEGVVSRGEADGEGGSAAEAVAKAAAEGGSEVEAESGPVPEPMPEPSVEELLAAERDQHLSDLQRVTAEFANFRKQTDKRNAETVRQAAARVMQAILPVLDACDAAARQQVEGVEPIAAQLRSVLEVQGLEVIDQAEAFDPNRHEAAMSEPGDEDQDEPMVSEVLRTGYAFNGRVLRAAMVRVKG